MSGGVLALVVLARLMDKKSRGRAEALACAASWVSRAEDWEAPEQLIELSFEVPGLLPEALSMVRAPPGEVHPGSEAQPRARNLARLVAAVVKAGGASPITPEVMLEEALGAIAEVAPSSGVAFSALLSAIGAAPMPLRAAVWPELSSRVSPFLYRWVLPDLALISPPAYVEATLGEAYAQLGSNARPYEVLAPMFSPAQLDGAVSRARRLESRRFTGASALRALLPRWGAEGNAEQALDWAREIAPPGERAMTLGQLMPYQSASTHQGIFDEIVDALGSLKAAYAHDRNTSVAAMAAALVPMGFADQLVEVAGRYAREAMIAIAKATRGSERRSRLSDAVECGAPIGALIGILDEVNPRDFFPRWCRAMASFSGRHTEWFLRDEYDVGAIEYLPMVRCLGGAGAPARLARVLDDAMR